MRSITYLVILLYILIVNCLEKENAQFRVPRSLEECYRDPFLVQRDNRLPMTIDTLINLIEKIENSIGFNQDIRQLAVSLVHRFRLDGISKAPGIETTPLVLPFSPAGFQFSKHRILLTRLIPGDAINFPNETLSSLDRCSLHTMVSSTFDLRVRGDEAQRCSQLSQYRAERLPRSVPVNINNDKSNFIGDVEFFEKNKGKTLNNPSGKLTRGKKVEVTPDYDETGSEEYEDTPFNIDSLFDVAGGAISQCPIEMGVVWTKWGAVAAGPLITGIAAGLQPQKVELRTLLSLASRRGTARGGQQIDMNVDNKWAATLAGDLAEVALLQGPKYKANTDVGASGAWNSTVNQKWYFLSQSEKLEMTDAEIRGGLDGLIIATKIAEWRGKAQNLKLSQLLSMYYSHQGVLDSGIRACDRKKNFIEFAPLEEMKSQTFAFANVLDREMLLRVTLTTEAIKHFSDQAAEKLSTFVPSMSDLSCESTLPTPNDPTEISTASDLYVFMDTTWQFNEINNIMQYIFENINVNKFATSITLMNAMDAKVIVNTTNNNLDILGGWNLTSHQQHPSGLNLPNVLRQLHNISSNIMIGEKKNSSVGGRSFISLIVPYTATVNDGDTNFAVQRIRRLQEDVPDLKILFLAGGSINRFEKFVESNSRDLFQVRPGDNAAVISGPVVKRIKEIPRRIINHRCGPDWNPNEWGQSQMNQYVTPGSVNVYRLAPNYFYKESSSRKMKFQGQGSSTSITVCSSRYSQLPRANMTNKPSDLKCRQLISNTFDVDLSNPCDGSYTIHSCPPYYFTIEAARQLSGNGQSNCIDDGCQYPNQIKYLVHTDSLSCFSGVSRNLSNIFILVISLYAYFTLT